jgi:hypothetical protein
MSDVYVPTTTKVYQKKQINIYNQQDRLSGVLVILLIFFLLFFRVEFQKFVRGHCVYCPVFLGMGCINGIQSRRIKTTLGKDSLYIHVLRCTAV